MATLHIEHPVTDLGTWLVWSSREASPALGGNPKARVLADVET